VAGGTVNGVSVTPTQIFCGGAGGGGVDGSNTIANGGAVNSLFGYPTITGGVGNATAPTNGADGVAYWKPFPYFTGGAGGGSDGSSGVGGTGGNGAWGCGGGGGGGGVTGGAGGRGGDGFVMIWGA
jgi:hypothetical protein